MFHAGLLPTSRWGPPRGGGGEEAQGFGLAGRGDRFAPDARMQPRVVAKQDVGPRQGGEFLEERRPGDGRVVVGRRSTGALSLRAFAGLRGPDGGAGAADFLDVLVVEEHGREGLAHVPLDVLGEQAQEEMSAHPPVEPVVDGPHEQVVALERAERPLGLLQLLVAPHGVLGGQRVGRLAGPHHPQAVVACLLGDLVVEPPPDQPPLVGPETRIGYELSCNGMLNCQILLDKKGLSIYLDDSAANDEAGPFLKIAFISDTRNLLASWARKGANIQSKILDNYFSETYNLWDEAMGAKSSTEQSIDYLNTKLLVGKNKSGRRDIVMVNNDGRKTLFEHGASGEKASIPISIILRYLTRGYDYEQAVRRSYNSIILDAMMGDAEVGKRFIPGDKILPFKNYCLLVHVEEPELSLDPMTQLRFADDLMRIMDSAIEEKKSLEASIMFTTHSPYWITALNTIAQEGKSKFLSWERLGGYLIKNDGTVESLRDEESHLLMTPNMDEASETLDKRYNLAIEGTFNGND